MLMFGTSLIFLFIQLKVFFNFPPLSNAWPIPPLMHPTSMFSEDFVLQNLPCYYPSQVPLLMFNTMFQLEWSVHWGGSYYWTFPQGCSGYWYRGTLYCAGGKGIGMLGLLIQRHFVLCRGKRYDGFMFDCWCYLPCPLYLLYARFGLCAVIFIFWIMMEMWSIALKWLPRPHCLLFAVQMSQYGSIWLRSWLHWLVPHISCFKSCVYVPFVHVRYWVIRWQSIPWMTDNRFRSPYVICH